METMNEAIHYKQCLFRETKEHLLEIQLNLPDYYPDVCRILSCRVRSCTESYRMDGDRITAEGIAVVRLLYCSEDKTMHLYESELRFSRSSVSPAMAKKPVLECCYKTVGVNYRAIGPRRVDVKATVSLSVALSDLTELNCNLPSMNGIETLQQEYELFDVSACYCDTFVINDAFSLRDERIADSRLLNDSVHVYETEMKIVKDKILIKGYAELNLTYLHPKEQIVFKYTESVPFSQIIDLYGVCENNKCSILLNAQHTVLSVKDSGECEVSVCVQVHICAGTTRNISVTKDLYAVSCEAAERHGSAMLQNNIRNFEDSFPTATFNEKVDCNDCQILAFYPSDIFCNTQITEEKLIASGQIETGILYIADGEMQHISRSLTFEYTREIDSICDAERMLHVVCKNMTCNKVSGGIQIKAELEISGFCLLCESVSYISTCEITPSESQNDFDTITLYFAEKGESVWEIAKQNRIPLQALKLHNDVPGETVESEKVLILLHSEVSV